VGAARSSALEHRYATEPRGTPRRSTVARVAGSAARSQRKGPRPRRATREFHVSADAAFGALLVGDLCVTESLHTTVVTPTGNANYVAPPTSPAVRLAALTKRFPAPFSLRSALRGRGRAATTVVDHVTFDVAVGEIFGLLGP